MIGMEKMMSDQVTLTPKKFSLEVEKVAFEKNITHMDAVIMCCEQFGLDPEYAAKLLTKSVKEKIELNAMDLNYLPKSAKLPV